MEGSKIYYYKSPCASQGQGSAMLLLYLAAHTMTMTLLGNADPVRLTGTRVSNAAAMLSCTHNDNDLLGNSNCVSSTKSTTYKVYIPPAEHVHRYYILQHYVMGQLVHNTYNIYHLPSILQYYVSTVCLRYNNIIPFGCITGSLILTWWWGYMKLQYLPPPKHTAVLCINCLFKV